MTDQCIITCHGYTGYPEEMKPLGSYFEDQGFEWINLTLPGHATTPEDLKSTTWTDWTNYVDEMVSRELQCHDEVYFAGLSLGGAITLYALQQFPELSAGITLAAPTSILNWWQKMVAKVPFLDFWITRTDDEIADIRDPTRRSQHRAYLKHHTKSVRQLDDFVNHVSSDLHKITQPIIIFHSQFDQVVPRTAALEIYDKISSATKELVIVEKSGHVLTRDYDSSLIFEQALAFVQSLKG